MSTFNGSAFIGEQIESILSQVNVEVHLFVRDDGSTDSTPEALDQYRNSPRVVITKGRNLGPVASYFALVNSCEDSYDYYAYSDQDDVWKPEKLYRATQHIADIRSPHLYCSALTLVDSKLNELGKHAISIKGDPKAAVPFQNVATGNTVVLNKPAFQLVKKHPGPAACIMHDWWTLLLILYAGGGFTYDTESRILYRQHEGNVVGLSLKRASLLHLIDKYRTRIRECLNQAAALRHLDIQGPDQKMASIIDSLCQGRGSILKRLAAIITGAVQGRTPTATLGFAVMYLLYGDVAESDTGGLG